MDSVTIPCHAEKAWRPAHTLVMLIGTTVSHLSLNPDKEEEREEDEEADEEVRKEKCDPCN